MGRVAKLELKRDLSRLTVAGLMVFLLLSFAINQIGILKYKTEMKRQVEFTEVEQRKVQRFINYMQYGAYGFKRLLDPSPLVAFFYNSTTLNDLQAIIDVGIRLEFIKPEVGENMFEKPTGGSLDFSYYLLMFGSMLIVSWSFFSFRNKKYIRFLKNFAGNKSVYLGIILGRIIFIIISLTIIVGVAGIQFLINGIKLTANEIYGLLIFLLMAFALMMFLLIISSAFGTIENWVKGGIIAISFWLIVVWWWPEILNLTFSSKAATYIKSRYKHEIQKVDKLMAFEKMSLERARDKRYKTDDERFHSDKEMSEHYWNNVFKEIEALEFEMMENMEKNAEKFHFWSILNPVTFYKSVNNELSSRGYNTYMDFYRDNQKKQRGFLRYYFNKRFYENYAKVKAYLPDKEYIVAAKSSLPKYFGAGILVTLGYIAALLLFVYRRFTKYITGKRTGIEGIEGLNINIQTGKLNYFLTGSQNLKDFVYQYFSGQRPKNDNIKVDGKLIKQSEFRYLFDTTKFPKIGNNDIYKFITGRRSPGDKKLWEILIENAVETGNLIIFDDFFKDLKKSEVDAVISLIRKKGLLSLYISKDHYMGLSIADNFVFSSKDTTIDTIKQYNSTKN